MSRRGNRTFLNMQEQNVLFMASLWLYAVFVSPSDATDLGYAYLILRSMYPVVWAVLGGEKGMPEAGSMLTFPQYAICLFQVVSVIMKLNYDADFKDYFLGYKTLGVFAFFACCRFFFSTTFRGFSKEFFLFLLLKQKFNQLILVE